MPSHICEKCDRSFNQKSHLDDHLQRKKDCVPSTNTLSFETHALSAEDNDVNYELSDQREDLYDEYNKKQKRLQRVGRDISYPNQKEAAAECLKHYQEGKLVVALVAQPGAGKTGTAQEVMVQLGLHADDNLCVPTKQMIICSGMSDCEWREQFKGNMIKMLSENVHHRGNLPREIEKLKTARLVVDDECHVAAGMDMMVSRIFKEAGLLNVESLENRRAKILEISATPDATIHDLKRWGIKAAIVRLKPGPIYKGFEVMLGENRIRASPNLESLSAVVNLLRLFDNRFSSTTKKYFVFRVSPKVTKWIEEASKIIGWDNPIYHDSTSRIEDIDKMMERDPTKHVAICVKGFWRASKRLVRNHVGGSYETIPKGKRNTTATGQGLTARFCDNYEYSGDMLNPDLRPLHFCDVDAIREYLVWFNTDCDYTKAAYTSSRISSNGRGRVTAPKTKVHVENVQGLEAVPEAPRPKRRELVPIGPKNTVDEVRAEIKKIIKRNCAFQASWIDKQDPTNTNIVYKVSTRMGNNGNRPKKEELEARHRVTEEEYLALPARHGTGPNQEYAVFPVYKADGTLVWYGKALKPLSESTPVATVLQAPVPEAPEENTLIMPSTPDAPEENTLTNTGPVTPNQTTLDNWLVRKN